MSTRGKIAAFLTATAMGLVALGPVVSPAQAKSGDIQLKCKVKGANQIMLHARFDQRNRTKGVREKFSAEFEARTGGSFISGQQVSIVVDTVTVGIVTLTPAPSGELSGQLEFDSKPSAGHVLFPPNFPDVAAGSTVEASSGTATILGCELQ